ncbi:hypothetical protein HNP71_002688 [Acidocella aromatica]|uniref:Uncharacterized protein n=1 Tax=Acidocella aromatica TaxID=1303579 RepID=A0A840VF50_9PROT|nr:hypothetical protein [Acidocella aromatica]
MTSERQGVAHLGYPPGAVVVLGADIPLTVQAGRST